MVVSQDYLSYVPGCRFCFRPEPWRVIHNSTNFVVQMGLGPLAAGYALLLARSHYSCCAAIPRSQLPEFIELVLAVQSAQRSLYRSSLVFEHGRSGACLPPGHGEDLCYHAHLHLLPTAFDLAAEVNKAYPMLTLPDWGSVLSEYAADCEPYLLMQKPGGFGYVSAPEGLPKRYLRRVLARNLGEPLLEDWVAFPSYDLVEQGRAQMAPALERVLARRREDFSGTSVRPEGSDVPGWSGAPDTEECG